MSKEERAWAESDPDELWALLLTGEAPMLRRGRYFLRHLPADPRCKLCNAPFHGAGAPLMRLIGKAPSQLNPRFCKTCLDIAPIGGAEIELTLLFADVRGSTTLAEGMSPLDYSRLINHFYSAATRLFIQSDGLIDRLVGDQVIALYLPGLAGPRHASIAIETGQSLLRADTRLPIGVGVHHGTAFVGKVGQAGVTDFTVLGDAANVTARLSSIARSGELLISDPALSAANYPTDALEQRMLELKGRSEPLKAWSWLVANN